MAVAAQPANTCLYVGSVRHRRIRPATHQFRYDVCSLLVDLDELPAIRTRFRFFSVNRWNVFSFFERDHGPRDGSSLKAWINGHLAANGIAHADGAVRLLCFPRVLGYVFNPLSVWFCHDACGALQAILLEVSNVAGESHSYLVSAAGGARGIVRARFDKRFHVSAFIGMDARYECEISEPGEGIDLRIREFEKSDETLIACWSGRRRPLTTWRLLAVFGRYPFMTFRITAAIYWQAMRLVLKRVPRHARRDRLPAAGVTYIGVADAVATTVEDRAGLSAAAEAGTPL
jgi:uncharacterized protein